MYVLTARKSDFTHATVPSRHGIDRELKPQASIGSACVSRVSARCGETMGYCVADWMWHYFPDNVCTPMLRDYLSCSVQLFRPTQEEPALDRVPKAMAIESALPEKSQRHGPRVTRMA